MRSPGEKKWLGTCLWHFVMPAICSAGVSLAELSVPEDPSDIVCASVSPSSLEVAVCTDNKSLALWKRREEGEAGDACWTWQGKRYVWRSGRQGMLAGHGRGRGMCGRGGRRGRQGMLAGHGRGRGMCGGVGGRGCLLDMAGEEVCVEEEGGGGGRGCLLDMAGEEVRGGRSGRQGMLAGHGRERYV